MARSPEHEENRLARVAKYGDAISRALLAGYAEGATEVTVAISQLHRYATDTGVAIDEPLGKIVKSFVSRDDFSDSVKDVTPEGQRWSIKVSGKADLKFELVVEKSKALMYAPILARIFINHYKQGEEELEFQRSEIEYVAKALGIGLPKNLGDLIYSFRYRQDFPKEILERTPSGKSWIIMGAGRSKYRFILGQWARVEPQAGRQRIKIYDATPAIIRRYAQNDEQALLAKVRYNRLVDTFLGITTYSLQNHLRTTVPSIGQIEVDELYVGVSKTGAQFVVPVQAKVDSDRHSVVQTLQDAAFCDEHYPRLVRRCVSAQFLRSEDVIVMFELAVSGREVAIRDEKHYRLVSVRQPVDPNTPTEETISAGDLAQYALEEADPHEADSESDEDLA